MMRKKTMLNKKRNEAAVLKKAAFLTVLIILLFGCVFCYAEDASGEYLVRLKNNVSYDEIEELCADEIKPVVSEWNIYKISEDDANNIDMSVVEYIEPNCSFELMDSFPNDTYYNSFQLGFMEMTKVPYAWNFNCFGAGVKVAVIDSGISLSHPDLQNRIAQAVNYTNTETVEEEQVHGSSVAGIIGAEINNGMGIAGISKADLYIMKVVEDGKVSLERLTKAMADAIEVYDCDVINLSLGTDSISEEDLNSVMLAVEKAYDNGTVVVASAGNTGNEKNLPCYPASMQHVISVSAVDKNGNAGTFSQHNDMVDVAAPGVNVYSAKASGYGYVTGTSFSAPYVAGICALVKGARANINQDDIERMLKYSSTDAGAYGYDEYYGWGIINTEKLIKMAEGREPYLHPSYLTYDAEKKSVKISYFNTANTSEEQAVCRIAIYDEYDKLVYISEPTELKIASFEEENCEFDGVTVPTNGKVKAFCMKEYNSIAPAAFVAEMSL